MTAIHAFHHATHVAHDHLHAHPVWGSVEIFTGLGLAVAATLLLVAGVQQIDATAPPAAATQAQQPLEEDTEKKKGWVWEKRVSYDNPIYAFGKR